MPQIINITSEAIQAQIRRLLPSQQGFGIDIEASSVITPVIDITPAAEGSQLPDYLQRAKAHGSQTTISAEGTTSSYNLTPGFWSIDVVSTILASNTAARTNAVQIVDASTTKTIWFHKTRSGGINGEYVCVPFNDVIFLRAGDSLSIEAGTNCNIGGSVRQLATVNGDFVVPNGFSFE